MHLVSVLFECIGEFCLWIMLKTEVFILFQVSRIVVDLTVSPIPQPTLCISPNSNDSGAIPECGIRSSVPLVGDNLCQNCTYVQKISIRLEFITELVHQNLKKWNCRTKKHFARSDNLRRKLEIILTPPLENLPVPKP